MSHLLYGQNGLLLEERVASLRAAIDPQGLGATVIDVQASSASEVASACQAMPFFGGRRLVVLRNPIQLSRRGDATTVADPEEAGGRVKWADLHAVLKAVPDSTEIVMRHDGSLSPNHFLVKAVKALGWNVESFANPTGQDLLAWIHQRVEAHGATIGGSVVEHLAERLYPTSWNGGRYATEPLDMRLIATEVDKLCAGAIDGVVSREIVDELVADRSGVTAFKLNDDLFSGRTEGALIELDNTLAIGEADERILAMIGSEAIAIATVMASSGLSREAVASASGISSSRLNGLQQTAARLSEPMMSAIIEAIRAADANVKSGLRADTSATIVPLVAEVAEVVRRGGGAGRRSR